MSPIPQQRTSDEDEQESPIRVIFDTSAAAALDTDGASSADRKACRIYVDRLNAFALVSHIR